MEADTDRLDYLDAVPFEANCIFIKIDPIRDTNRFTIIDKDGRLADFPDIRSAIDGLVKHLSK